MPARLSGYAPLQEFQWDGNFKEFTAGLSIRRMPEPDRVSDIQAQTAQWFWDKARRSSHWLVYESDDEPTIPLKDAEHLIQLALWLRRPTRTCIGYRIEIERKPDGNERTSCARLKDVFAWYQEEVAIDYTSEDIDNAAELFKKIVTIYKNQGRLSSSVVLTITGCWSHSWQSALITHAAAAESLLTYSTGLGITRRLAKSYACLTETLLHERDLAYREFIELYDARSDVVHGRSHQIIGPQNRRETLVRFQTMLRRIWLRILSDDRLVFELEQDDVHRTAFFNLLENGYSSPTI